MNNEWYVGGASESPPTSAYRGKDPVAEGEDPVLEGSVVVLTTVSWTELNFTTLSYEGGGVSSASISFVVSAVVVVVVVISVVVVVVDVVVVFVDVGF